MVVGIHDDLDFLFATLMTVQCQSCFLLMGDGHYSGRVAQDITVHQQEVLATNHLTSHPQRVDVVVVLVISIVEEGKMDVLTLGIILQKAAYHLTTISRHHHIFLDASLLHGAHGALQKRLSTYFQQTFRLGVCQGAQALGHSCC